LLSALAFYATEGMVFCTIFAFSK